MAKQKYEYGIHHLDVDGQILMFDEDIEMIKDSLCIDPNIRVWTRKTRSKCPRERLPKRLVQFRDCDWTLLYLCDGMRSKEAFEFFSDQNLEQLSMTEETKMLSLELSDTAGVYRLREYWIGELVDCMATDCRSYSGESREKCRRVTVDEIDQRLKDLKVFYSAIEDGGRTPDGAIRPYEETDPNAHLVRKHYLLV